jgi:small GTP-binding protein
MIKRKVCMLGAYAVGKTSLVESYVRSMFSDRYLTTVGVKIEKKTLQSGGTPIDLLIWDIQGEDESREAPIHYLRGASAYLLVADGTRRETLSTACAIRERVEQAEGALPFVLLLNKRDMTGDWEIEKEDEQRLRSGGWSIFHTSAKTREGIEEAFQALAERVLKGTVKP